MVGRGVAVAGGAGEIDEDALAERRCFATAVQQDGILRFGLWDCILLWRFGRVTKITMIHHTAGTR